MMPWQDPEDGLDAVDVPVQFEIELLDDHEEQPPARGLPMWLALFVLLPLTVGVLSWPAGHDDPPSLVDAGAPAAAAVEAGRLERPFRDLDGGTAASPRVAADTESERQPSEDQLLALRTCESGGRYDAVSADWLYRGAYQFHQMTWDEMARRVEPGYEGTDPALAPPSVQDALAAALWRADGPHHWPVCGPRAVQG